jgi:hypothetical protein
VLLAPPPPPPPAPIVAVHNFDVRVLEAGGGPRRIVLRDAETPAWSPDASRIAAASGKLGIVTVAADGTDRRVVVGPGSGGAETPVWSPDGSELAFLAHDAGGAHGRVEVIGSDGTNRRVVVRAPARTDIVDVSDWTPDGTLLYTRVAEDGGAYGPSTVRRVAVDGSGDARLLADAEHAVLSPDGSRLALGTFRGTKGQSCGIDSPCDVNADIAVADADGANRRIVVRTEQHEVDPSWSSDGEQIAFSSARNVPDRPLGDFLPGGGRELYSTDPQGTCLSWLTNGDRGTWTPAWAPDAAPGPPTSCGDSGLEPEIELTFSAARRRSGLVWLGHTFGSTLLGAVHGGPRRTVLHYEDCAAFDPGGCTPFALTEDDACAGHAFFDPLPRRARRLGDLVIVPSRGDGVPPVFVAGRRVVSVFAGVPMRAIGRALRPLTGALDRPALPQRVRRRLPAGVRGFTVRCAQRR